MPNSLENNSWPGEQTGHGINSVGLAIVTPRRPGPPARSLLDVRGFSAPTKCRLDGSISSGAARQKRRGGEGWKGEVPRGWGSLNREVGGGSQRTFTPG